ncbi:MAG: hypothetical protein BWY35_00217 [Firmicutes bacterium ADurb.Bin248]|nr:MAG: hypothetical protein BWY35_00217 [Firmicutes bacterium ADurb.Bin248]HOF99474.1 hypothetical protein [Clostridia bacterium]HPK15167.1 hypothetical protein [Clostridia bacterium]
MNRKFRILCMILALVFILVFLVSIVVSFAQAEALPAAGTRGETVYVDADANGNPLSMISSVYIGNPDKLETIVDHTTLTDIKNIAGNEEPVVDGDAVTFLANGEDVCYQGVASGELPFSVSVRYYLEGKLVTPEEIAGKSGHVRIEVGSANNLARKAAVDGEMMELYVPFSLICMMSLDETFTAVSAEGAKLSAQAGRITILSVLLPGLAKSLGTQDSERIKDGFVIEADVKNFGLGSMMFIGMTGIIDENDLSGIDDVEGLLAAIDGISAASTELYKGSKGIRNGLEEFGDGLALYVSGVAAAAEGALAASEGAEQLGQGMKELDSGTGQFSVSIDQIADAVDDARDLLNAAADPDAPVDPATKEIILDAVEEAARSAAAKIEADLRASLEARLAPHIPDPDERQAVIDAIVGDLDLDGFEITLSDGAFKAICDAVLSTTLARELVDKVNELADGAEALASGAGALASGADALDSAMAKLAGGLSELADGLNELDANGETMAAAFKSLTRGSRALTEGLKILGEEGLKAVVDETADIGVSISRKEALLALAQEYTSFTCTRPNPGDTVQFVLTTEEIAAKAPLENTPQPSPAPGAVGSGEDAGEGFFARLGQWFEELFASIRGWFE